MQRIFPVTLLTCAMSLATVAVQATPRGATVEPEPDTPETLEARRLQMQQDLAAWLPRLVGRFSYEGVADLRSEGELLSGPAPGYPPRINSATGKGDCIAIGAGPGVQCVIHVVWNEEWGADGRPIEGGVSFLGPAATLYGFDPNTATIRYLMLNTNGVAEAQAGPLKGDTVRWNFETQCESDTTLLCRRVIRIGAAPDSKFVQLSIDIERFSEGRWVRMAAFTFDMRRVPQDQVEAAS